MIEENDILSSDGERVVEILDLFGRKVRRGDILVEQTGSVGTPLPGGGFEWSYSWTAFEMPRIADGSGYRYHNGQRSRFWWAAPSRAVVIDNEKFCNLFRSSGFSGFDIPVKEGTAEEVLAAVERKYWA